MNCNIQQVMLVVRCFVIFSIVPNCDRLVMIYFLPLYKSDIYKNSCLYIEMILQ